MDILIAGGISGAITDTGSPEAKAHAGLYYEEIRKRTSDVKIIAERTGFSYEQILLVKQYLFFDTHLLEEDGVPRYFDPCFEIAQSWQRLCDINMDIKPHDIVLIQHELFESKLVSEGLAQEDAHIVASKKYNYTKMSDEYYAGLGVKTSDSDINSGGIHRLSFKTH